MSTREEYTTVKIEVTDGCCG